MKYYIKKYEKPYEPLNKNYPNEVMEHWWQGDDKKFKAAVKNYDNYYGTILPEVEVTASKTTPTETSNWTSEHNVAEDNKKYEQVHQAESQKIASAVSNKMNEVGNKIGSTALIGGVTIPSLISAPLTFMGGLVGGSVLGKTVDNTIYLTSDGQHKSWADWLVNKTDTPYINHNIAEMLNPGAIVGGMVGGIHLNKFDRAIKDNRFLPLMTYNQKRNYINTVRNKYKDIVENHTIPMNQKHILNEKSNIENFKQILKNFGEDEVIWLDDLYKFGEKYNLSKDQLKEYSLIKELPKNEYEYGVSEFLNGKHLKTPDQLIKEDVPRLKLTKDLDKEVFAYYDPSKNLVAYKPRESKFILNPIDETSRGANWVLAHELDHWIQYRIPKLNNTVKRSRDYYHINDNPSNEFINDYPGLKNIQFSKWASSPHEWRSELAGFARVIKNPDISSWSNSQNKAFNRYMDVEFMPIQKSIKNNTGMSLGDLVKDMYLKGYKQGGSIHIKEKK